MKQQGNVCTEIKTW